MQRQQHSSAGRLATNAAIQTAAALGLCTVMLGAGWWWGQHGAATRAKAAVGTPAAQAARGATAGLPSFAELVERVGPGVVQIQALLRPAASTIPAADPAARAAAVAAPRLRDGSGFVVHQGGLVLTCRHVVADAVELTVHFADGQRCRGELVGEDAAHDLAMVRLLTPPAPLTVLPIGHSEGLRAGDWILAIGNPLGLGQTVTAGIVSHQRRHLPHSDFALTHEFLQFSAPTNPGCSGGPVLSLAGEVVGVITQSAEATQGIAFAVPSRTLQWSLQAMEASPDGRVRQGYLGIEFADEVASGARRPVCRGARILRVAAGQPAHRAGIQPGDVVVGIDGAAIEEASALHDRIVRSPPGTRLALQLVRGGQALDPVEAVLGEVGGTGTAWPAN